VGLDMEKDWGVNDKLLKTLEKQVKKIVAEPFREDAIDVLSRCTDKTIKEFLHFAFLENYNLACTCLEFATDKETGEPLKNKTFGSFLSKETLDELFEAHDPEDFIDEDFKDWERASLEDFIDEGNDNGWIGDYIEIGLEDEVLIELEEWDHECGDGCCHTYGTNIYVNGEQLENEDGTNPHQLLTAVLTKLGYTNVRVEHK
jgi:hypothetical protein